MVKCDVDRCVDGEFVCYVIVKELWFLDVYQWVWEWVDVVYWCF